MADWYPASMDALAAWWENFVLRRPDFEGKYPILGTQKSELDAANLWIQYWVAARHAADELSQQLSRYWNTISGNDSSLDPPSPINWTLPGSKPAEVPPGIEKFIRDIRREVVGSTNYAKADGDAMGFEAATTTPDDPSTMKPDFAAETQVNFALKITFRKFGMDGQRFEYRHKGGNWLPAGTLLVSGGLISIAPQTPGTAEQIELRSFFIQGNDNVGQVSDTKTATIAP